MDKRYSTIIFVPHARAKFRKLKVSHRLLFSVLSLVTSSLCLSTFFSVQYFTSLSQTHELSKLRRRGRDRAAQRRHADRRRTARHWRRRRAAVAAEDPGRREAVRTAQRHRALEQVRL